MRAAHANAAAAGRSRTHSRRRSQHRRRCVNKANDEQTVGQQAAARKRCASFVWHLKPPLSRTLRSLSLSLSPTRLASICFALPTATAAAAAQKFTTMRREVDFAMRLFSRATRTNQPPNLTVNGCCGRQGRGRVTFILTKPRVANALSLRFL